MFIKELLDWGHKELIVHDSARLDAELLLAEVLGTDLAYILAHNDERVSRYKERKYRKLVARRKEGIPLAYLQGYKEFYGLVFEVNKHVLVPRPDTEILVEAVIDYLKPGDILLDVGTGSACIPVAVLKHVREVEAWATDISYAALKVAAKNVQLHGLKDRIHLLHSDLLDSVDIMLFEGDKLVVTANLPYVPKGYEVNIETRFEPQIALYGGDDGLDIYKKLLEQLLEVRPRAIFFECFDFQVAMLGEHAPGYVVKWTKPMMGKARMLMLERSD